MVGHYLGLNKEEENTMWIADVEITPKATILINLDDKRMKAWLKRSFYGECITNVLALRRTSKGVVASVAFTAEGSDQDKAVLLKHSEDRRLITAYLESRFAGGGTCEARNLQSVVPKGEPLSIRI